MDFKITNKFNFNFFSYLSLILLSLLLIPFSDVSQPSPEYALYGTLFEGKFLNLYSEQWPYFDPKLEGRFNPLVGIHLNLIFLYNSLPTIFDVYLIQAIMSILFSFYLINFLRILNLDINPIYLSLFIIMPSYVFSFYHPFLVESYSLLSLVVFFHILYRALSENSIIYFLILIFLLINLLIAKISFFSILIIFSLSYSFCMFHIKKEFHMRNLIILIIIFLASISFFILNIKISGAPADRISLSLRFFHLFLQSDILLYLFSFITINFFIIFIVKSREFKFNDVFILCMSLSSIFYFFLLIMFGKHDGYQQVVSYFLFAPLIVFIFKKDILLQNKFIKFSILILITYLIYYQRFHLVITIIISLSFYLYFFLHKRHFQNNSSNIIKMSIIVLSIWSLFIPGIFTHVDHKFKSTSVGTLVGEIKNYSYDNNEIYIQHVSYLDNCHGSIMQDFVFAERLKYEIPNINFYFLPMPNYEISTCSKEYSKFEDDYADLDDSIFKFYKEKNFKKADFIFFKPTKDLHSFFNKNFNFKLDHLNDVEYEKKNQIWDQLIYFASLVSSFRQTPNSTYLMIKPKS